MTAYVVEVRKNGGTEWERMWTFSDRARADKMARVAKGAIDVAETRVRELQ